MKLEKIEAQAPVKTSMAVFDGDDMRFHPTEAGKEAMVREAVLHEDTTFDGTTYAAGTQILFSSTGKVRASRMYQRRWPDGYPAPAKNVTTSKQSLRQARLFLDSRPVPDLI